MTKPILCLDFDGVVHSYKSGWQGVDAIPDPPTEGFFEWLATDMPHFRGRISPRPACSASSRGTRGEHMSESETDKAFEDAMLYGTGFIKDGKRIAPEDVLADIAEGEPDPDDLAEKIWCKGRATAALTEARAALSREKNDE